MNNAMNKVITACFLIGLCSTAMAAGNVAAGKTKALSCGGCHGTNGMSPNPAWPNLAKQNADYTAKQLKDFRTGTRKDPMMEAMAAPLSDADILDLAAYYEKL